MFELKSMTPRWRLWCSGLVALEQCEEFLIRQQSQSLLLLSFAYVPRDVLCGFLILLNHWTIDDWSFIFNMFHFFLSSTLGGCGIPSLVQAMRVQAALQTDSVRENRSHAGVDTEYITTMAITQQSLQCNHIYKILQISYDFICSWTTLDNTPVNSLDLESKELVSSQRDQRYYRHINCN